MICLDWQEIFSVCSSLLTQLLLIRVGGWWQKLKLPHLWLDKRQVNTLTLKGTSESPVRLMMMSLECERKQQCEFIASTMPLMQFVEIWALNTFISSPFHLFITLCCLFHTDTNLKWFLLILYLATLHHHSGTDLYIIAYLLTTGYSGDGCCTCTCINKSWKHLRRLY